MIQLFTQETLIRYVYDDLPPADRQELEAALRRDPELAAECAGLFQLRHAMNEMMLSPSASTTSAILQAARR